MKLLAIETATDLCGIALNNNNQLVAENLLNKKNIHNILGALLYFHDTKKLMDEFIYSQKRENVLILDIEKLIFDDNSIEIDKLIEFTCITDVKKETIVKLIHLYRDAQFNLNYHPIWDKFLIA